MSRVYGGFVNVYVPTREIAALVRYIRDYFAGSWILRISNYSKYVFALAHAIGKSVSKRGRICINALETMNGNICSSTSQLSVWDDGVCVDMLSDSPSVRLGGIELEVKSLSARVSAPTGWVVVPFYNESSDLSDEKVDFDIDVNYLIALFRDFVDAKLAYDFWWISAILPPFEGLAFTEIIRLTETMHETLKKIALECSLVEYLHPRYPQLHLPPITAESVVEFLDPTTRHHVSENLQ